MFLYYRERDVANVGPLEDILEVKNGTVTLRSNCVPGDAEEIRRQASFFGAPAAAVKVSSAAFEILLSRYGSPSTNLQQMAIA